MQQQHHDKELYRFPTARTQGVVATVIFHIIVVLILVIFGFKAPPPPPEEEGILVNFGYDETGSGLLEPSSSTSAPATMPETEEGVTDNVAEIIEEVSEAAEAVSDPEVENMTQDFEEAAVVEKKVEQPDPEEEARKKAEAERIRKEQEAERIKQEQLEAERIRIEDSIRLAREQEQRRQDIMNRTRNALSNSQGSDTGKNQGVSGGEGNQGVETGAAGVNRYGEGSGTGNEGVSWDLAGRNIVTQVKPKYDTQEEGIVVVEITVDRNGNVTTAVPGVKGSTTLEDYFLRVAKEAALATKFDRKPDARVFQKGTITYIFKLR